MSLFDPDPVDIALGEVLKSIREGRSLPPEKFAWLLGLSAEYYTEIETAACGVGLPTLFKIAKNMGCAPEVLITGARERLAAAFGLHPDQPRLAADAQRRGS